MRLRYLVMFFVSLTVSLAARADTIQTFDLFTFYFAGNVIGTVGLDLDTGQFVSADLAATGLYAGTFTGPADPQPSFFPNETVVGYDYLYLYPGSTPDQGGGYDLSLVLVLPSGDLRGYMGGPVCSVEAPCGEVTTLFYDSFTYGTFGGGTIFSDTETIESGSLTPVASTLTPEPSSLILLFTGLPGVILAVRGRFDWISRSARIASR